MGINARNPRKLLIRKIEQLRGSKLIVYFTGDRRPFSARIAEDAVRPLFDHLLNIKFAKRIDLFLYSRGGDVSVPWRIVSMIREFCDEFNVLIPYRAQSAATLISMGADKIIMGKKAELGPIDPTLQRVPIGETPLLPQEIPVENVNSFLSFVKERANINDQEALAKILIEMVKEIGPLTLGNVNRQHYHIRLVARKLLTSRKEKLDEEKISTIIETLTEKIYSHGHAIGRKEAKDIGLPVDYPDAKLENAMWKLYLEYENFLKLHETIYPEIVLRDKDVILLKDLPIAVIESYKKLHVFRTHAEIRAERRALPNINLNLPINLPPNLNPQNLPQYVKQFISELSKAIPEIIQQELKKQSPILRFQLKTFGGKWKEE